MLRAAPARGRLLGLFSRKDKQFSCGTSFSDERRGADPAVHPDVSALMVEKEVKDEEAEWASGTALMSLTPLTMGALESHRPRAWKLPGSDKPECARDTVRESFIFNLQFTS